MDNPSTIKQNQTNSISTASINSRNGTSVSTSLSLATQNVQNIYSTKIHQMITDSLLSGTSTTNNTRSNNTNTNVYSNFQPTVSSTTSTALSQNSNNLNILKTNLLNVKASYEVITTIPITKPTIVDGLINTEWNRYLIE